MIDHRKQKNRFLYKLTAFLTTVSLFSCACPPVTALGAKKQEIIVAVIDTGVNTDHELLHESIWINNREIPGNGRDDDRNGYVDDICGWDFYNGDNSVFHDISYSDSVYGNDREDDHGTHVAGLVKSEAEKSLKALGGDNSCGIRIMVLKINGGPEAAGSTSDAVKAIKYAEANGASICNLSWGSYNDDGALKNAIKGSDMLFVCCAGNDGTDNDNKPLYPASYPFDNIISVTGAETGEELRITGNYGKTSVDVCADGMERWSALSYGYGFKSGASMATATVSGIAAALMAAGDISAVNTKEKIIEGSEKVPGLTGVKLIGGLCDPQKMKFGKFPQKQEITKTEPAAIMLNYNEITVKAGGGFRLDCLLLPVGCDTEISFSSSDEEVAEVSYNGLVLCHKAGDTLVKVKTQNGREGVCLVHVE